MSRGTQALDRVSSPKGTLARRGTAASGTRRWQFRWRRAFLLLVVLALFAAGLAAPHLGTFLEVSEPPQPAEATVLTYSVSTLRALLDEAAARYRSGDGPTIVLSELLVEGASRSVMPPAGQVAREYLVAQGIPSEAIDVLQAATSENEEVFYLRQEAQPRGWHRLTVYVLARRSRRSTAAFKHAFTPIGVDVRVVAIPEPVLDKWWQSREGVSALYNEYPRLLYYALRGRL